MHQNLEITDDHPVTESLSQAKFAPGKILATPASLAVMEEHGCLPLTLLARHLRGDWGSVPTEDAEANNEALKFGGRLLSSYVIAPNVIIWLISEADRSASTFLMPSEY